MNRLTIASLLALVALAAAALGAHFTRAPAPRSPLAQLAFLVGAHEGTGEHSAGFPYHETMSAEWALSDSILVLRSRSAMAERMVFEDLRVFTYDVQDGAIRCRQFCFGWVTTYDVEVDEETGAVVMTEIAAEGGKTSKWRYRIEPASAGEEDEASDGFSYVLETTNRDGEWGVFTKGSLKEDT